MKNISKYIQILKKNIKIPFRKLNIGNTKYNKKVYIYNNIENRKLKTNAFIVNLPIDNIETYDILGFEEKTNNQVIFSIYDSINLPIFEFEKHLKNKSLLKDRNIIIEYLDTTGLIQYKKIYYNINIEDYKQITPNTYDSYGERIFNVVFNYNKVEIVDAHNGTTC